ncbi:MAG TPA: hypothetical protein VFP56_04685 [Candidatus Limnocylindrales bacterium]|nr:hypothetical protein [Candidatus Limnocylindrales bacterium]
MDENTVRSSAQMVGDALVAGNVDAVIGYLSPELQRNPGEIVAMLPLPATSTEIVSVEHATSAVVVVLRVVGETAEDELQTRWKDRDGEPRIVEVSHLSRTEREGPAAGAEGEGADGAEGAQDGAGGGGSS